MSISTREGDDGTTRLFSGEEVSKHHPRPAAYGDLDEAVSAMGLARALASSPRVRKTLREIQRRCFVVGSELATSPGRLDRLEERLEEEHLVELDTQVEELEAQVELPPVFVIPGGCPAGAALDLARSVTRRLERSTSALAAFEGEGVLSPHLQPWINRLSDVLFLLARLEEQQQGVDYDRLK
ncbi:MAG: cob(I)yrinic acid a,c-diamide adenosyltransferase [bacterium]